MEELTKLEDSLYTRIELEVPPSGFSKLDLDGIPKIKVKIPYELINRINEIITLLNILSKSKIIRSAIALEEGTEKKEKNG